MWTWRRLAVGVAVACTPLMVGAQDSVTVGTANTTTCQPYGCFGSIMRYQQVFAADAFAGPMTIGQIDLFHTLAAGPAPMREAGFDFYLTTTSKPVNGLDGDDLDANITGAPLTYFGSHYFWAILPNGDYPSDSVVTITATTPFTYDPAMGNLLLEATLYHDYGSGGFQFDADATGATTSSAYYYVPDGRMLSPYTAASPLALVTRFDPVTTTPEPASLVLLGTGLVGLVPVVRRRSARSR